MSWLTNILLAKKLSNDKRDRKERLDKATYEREKRLRENYKSKVEKTITAENERKKITDYIKRDETTVKQNFESFFRTFSEKLAAYQIDEDSESVFLLINEFSIKMKVLNGFFDGSKGYLSKQSFFNTDLFDPATLSKSMMIPKNITSFTPGHFESSDDAEDWIDREKFSLLKSNTWMLKSIIADIAALKSLSQDLDWNGISDVFDFPKYNVSVKETVEFYINKTFDFDYFTLSFNANSISEVEPKIRKLIDASSLSKLDQKMEDGRRIRFYINKERIIDEITIDAKKRKEIWKQKYFEIQKVQKDFDTDDWGIEQWEIVDQIASDYFNLDYFELIALPDEAKKEILLSIEPILKEGMSKSRDRMLFVDNRVSSNFLLDYGNICLSKEKLEKEFFAERRKSH